ESRVLQRHDRGVPAAPRLELGAAIGRQPVADELAERFPDSLRVLAADEPEADLRACLGRDYRLEARPRVATPDAVHLGRRARPDMLERRVAALASRVLQPDIAQETLRAEGQLLPLGLH